MLLAHTCTCYQGIDLPLIQMQIAACVAEAGWANNMIPPPPQKKNLIASI